jgi:hypothetical protein
MKEKESIPKEININQNIEGSPLPDFMPLVTKATILNEKIPMKKSLNNMINTFGILRNEIPEEIIKEPDDENALSKNGICFGIQNGVQVMKNAEGDNKFNLQSENCANSKFILFDKNKPEIIFKEENMNDNENDNLGGNILNEDNIYAYPNPVSPDFTGPITIKGLYEQCQIKITTPSGYIVHKGIVSGGSYKWDGCDQNGDRVASGVYMVLVETPEGSKGCVTKIAILK